jgi:hypothetical protein
LENFHDAVCIEQLDYLRLPTIIVWSNLVSNIEIVFGDVVVNVYHDVLRHDLHVCFRDQFSIDC